MTNMTNMTKKCGCQHSIGHTCNASFCWCEKHWHENFGSHLKEMKIPHKPVTVKKFCCCLKCQRYYKDKMHNMEFEEKINQMDADIMEWVYSVIKINFDEEIVIDSTDLRKILKRHLDK